MGRKKLYHERRVAAFVSGTGKRIRKVLKKDEDVTDFIREWVEYGIEHRELRKKALSPQAHSSGQ